MCFLLEGLDGGVWQSKDRWGVRLRSAMFGVVQRGNVRVAVATRNFPKVCRAINAYGRARLPSWFTWTALGWYFPFKHYARAQAPGPLALECHCDCW